MTKYEKSRNWGFVVYPDSAPSNWMDQLQESGISFAVSPLHDKDYYPDGELKKAHWHVIVVWDGPVTDVKAKKISDLLNSPMPIRLESVRGAYRYFTHKDSPEKYQYLDLDIKVFNGFDISNYVALTKEEKYKAVEDIIDCIETNNFYEYFDLLSHLRLTDYNLFKVACDNTILINALIRSKRHKILSK